LPQATREIVVTEERAAWDAARIELDGLGFADWDAFDAQRALSLKSYTDALLPAD
jgi:hypothetical protein